jgi:integrase
MGNSLNAQRNARKRTETQSIWQVFVNTFRNPQRYRLREDRAGTEAPAKGRKQAREGSEISFHSLRHSAVTMLKAAGVSDFIAREIVGHESAAISRQYTHLTTDDKRAAMQRLPDVTNG